MVIAPTATSPPYFSREELKQMEMMLSLACMIKGATPSAMQDSSSRRTRMGSADSRTPDLGEWRKASTQIQLTA